MKVLFAVNSESISDAIIKKYQKDYREILSYKNVYYFNAIQKEIQKEIKKMQKMSVEELVERRYEKFRSISGFQVML